MTDSFAHHFDAHGRWRSALEGGVREIARFLREHELLDAPAGKQLDALGGRLADEKVVVAFVAEFSRGKSELINAIFFADAGQRILPASPGRTTMCPVELGHDAGQPSGLSLLPIETRLRSGTLSEWRRRPEAWSHTPLSLDDPDGLARALMQVRATRKVDVTTAGALGLWDASAGADNPPLDEQGLVEVPAWRHALINLPHPLLMRGLVVLDTPGLNAIGAEPELTLSLLPSAHATVFVLAADTGVTRSDLAIWRDHLAAPGVSRYVVLNKIDTLADPLSAPQAIEEQIDSQCLGAAQLLQLPRERIFPLSARQALGARMAGNPLALADSRLPALEDALSQRLLPERRQMLAQAGLDGINQIEEQTLRRLTDRRRQIAEQLIELRGLRGRSASKIALMLGRVDAESADFERCTERLKALHAVHRRMLKAALGELSDTRLRAHVDEMQEGVRSSLLQLGAKKAFLLLCGRLRDCMAQAQAQAIEVAKMVNSSVDLLNAEYGFSLKPPPAPELDRFSDDLALIETNYVQYIGVTQMLRLTQARFFAQFRRMLVARLRVVFQSASAELEVWSRSASAQIDTQLRERRRVFQRRREALIRIQAAAGELEARLAELETQEADTRRLQDEFLARVQDARTCAELPGALVEDAQDTVVLDA